MAYIRRLAVSAWPAIAALAKLACVAIVLMPVVVRAQESKVENATAKKPEDATSAYVDQEIPGWTVRMHRQLLEKEPERSATALRLLRQQLDAIEKLVPAESVKLLRHVPMWLSPTYPGIGPTAEYHPDAGWLRNNGRPAAMAKAIEFTNVLIFEAEVKRMPAFVLHELAHAFHDRVLGFDHPEIVKCFEQARDSKKYDAVERYDGKIERSYAMANHKEYFAELTESFFARNDFFPFTREQLKNFDPNMDQLLAKVWDTPKPDSRSGSWNVTTPPAQLEVDPFYKKYTQVDGFPIVASQTVNDYALKEAAHLVNLMLAQRPDVRRAMIQSGSRMCILAYNEFTTDLPEFARFQPKDFWDARARGTGGSATDPFCSCGEENLLGYDGDPYSTECILIHEFAHNIHLRGLVALDPLFDHRLKSCYQRACGSGLWKGTYASTNHHEYFAEGVQSWFNNNRENDHDHNHVNTRNELVEYDPGLAAICREVFGDTRLQYTKPASRLDGHLAGYNPANAPKFVWPERLDEARQDIRRKAVERSKQ